MRKQELVNILEGQIKATNDKNVKNALSNALRQVEKLEEPEIKSPQEKTPHELVSDCLNGLKDKRNLLSIGDINYLILNRVIKDIEFTSKKLC